MIDRIIRYFLNIEMEEGIERKEKEKEESS
jgi:hypothetical protein